MNEDYGQIKVENNFKGMDKLEITYNCDKYYSEKSYWYSFFRHHNVKIHLTQSNKARLIKYYDDHNVFILPSFTEGYPMVLLEALARRRPVIVFEEIKHVIGDKKGIFVSKRNPKSFFETAKNIIENYENIQKEMEKNVLPTKKNMIKQISDIIEGEVFN